jgi:hypothetical protein
MTAAPMPLSKSPTNPSLFLASSLFAETAALVRLPSDGVYADCLLILAFNHLSAGLSGTIDREALTACAENIAACGYLSEAVRGHVGDTLRRVSDGSAPIALGINIVAGAAARHSHQWFTDLVSAMGTEGLGNLADTVADAIDGLAEAVKGSKH